MKKQNMKSGDLLAMSMELNTLGIMHKIVRASLSAKAARAARVAVAAIGDEIQPGTNNQLVVVEPGKQAGTESTTQCYVHCILSALASARDITYHLQNAHWTVRSSSFAGHHKFFNDAYDLFWEMQDQLAEHLRAFDITAAIPNNPDGLRTFSVINISGIEAAVPSGSYEDRFVVHLSYYAVFLDQIINLLKTLYKKSQAPEIEDPAGETLFGDLLRSVMKQRWMVRAYKSVDEDADELKHSQRTAKHDMQEHEKHAYRFNEGEQK